MRLESTRSSVAREEVEGAEIEDDVEEEKIRDEASAWFPARSPPSRSGVCSSQTRTFTASRSERSFTDALRIWTPIAIKNWDVDSFRWSNWEDCHRSTQSGQQQVRHGDGRWIVYEPYGARSGATASLSLADKWLMRQWTWRDWARFTEKLGQGVFKAGIPSGAKPEDKTKFLGQVQRIGANGAVVLPAGRHAGRVVLARPADAGRQRLRQLRQIRHGAEHDDRRPHSQAEPDDGREIAGRLVRSLPTSRTASAATFSSGTRSASRPRFTRAC